MRAFLRFFAVMLLCVIGLRTVHVSSETTRRSYALRTLLDEWAALDNEARWLEGRVARLHREEHLFARAKALHVVVGSQRGETARVPPRIAKEVSE